MYFIATLLSSVNSSSEEEKSPGKFWDKTIIPFIPEVIEEDLGADTTVSIMIRVNVDKYSG